MPLCLLHILPVDVFCYCFHILGHDFVYVFLFRLSNQVEVEHAAVLLRRAGDTTCVEYRSAMRLDTDRLVDMLIHSNTTTFLDFLKKDTMRPDEQVLVLLMH